MSSVRHPPPNGKRTMRPPPRPAASRTASAMSGRFSPADSTSSMSTISSRMRSPPNTQTAGLKRKERDFDPDLGQETNINVVVRCRGRNDRELKENSGVVVSANGVKGDAVELSMGANALSNKTYTFDRVFSPAADQAMIFEDVVAPILDDVLAGFNCTIFAYGQTGTGKTYTMSGDISDILPIPDEAGIVPRVLHSLFSKLENSKADHSVKCSFIELYNEELRDLLSAEEAVKLKIFDDAQRKSHGATVVQGMEETHIQTASKGIRLLREGSHKRQVAATKCNDLSSRSHTVFTITVHVKRPGENGEEHVSAGKLNLVDLAGSENIQRSGAENKRATEAGLINKSLLTLGRVINALVEKGSHIPYRESKLTRLLQDSLGGRTKTCIIATLSPAKSNLEETISTLDYAFRAKNIRNKPQTNFPMSKKTLLREFTSEIEKLKSELIATRHRNGVYLSTESYEEITTESESRRILSEEQRDKIQTMEVNLRNKAQELFALTSNFNNLMKDNESTKDALEGTQDVLEKTEIALQHTRQSLIEESLLLQAHADTEEKLAQAGTELISTLGKTTKDISGLQSKLRRRSDLQSLNRTNWTSTQSQVSDTTQVVEQRLCEFENRHKQWIKDLSDNMRGFVQEELAKMTESTALIDGKRRAFESSESEINQQTAQARDEMDHVLENISTLKDDVKQKVGEGLDGLSGAAQQISAGILTELEGFHTQLHSSYSSLGRELKNTFDDLVKKITLQQEEVEDLKTQLTEAGAALVASNQSSSTRLDAVLTEEKKRAAEDRANTIAQVTALINNAGEKQDKRLDAKFESLKGDIRNNNAAFEKKQRSFGESMSAWVGKDRAIVDDILRSRETVKNTIKKDWDRANEQNFDIQANTRTVHEETVRIVDEQMKHMDVQLQAFDEILARVRMQNGRQHDSHVASLQELGDTVRHSYSSINEHMTQATGRTELFAERIKEQTEVASSLLDDLPEDIRAPLAGLRADILATALSEYVPTGETPRKIAYDYRTELPRTEPHEVILERFRNPDAALDTVEETDEFGSMTPTQPVPSPTKGLIYTDHNTVTFPLSRPTSTSPTLTRTTTLKEIDVNIIEPSAATLASSRKTKDQPPLKRQNTGIDNALSASVGPGSKSTRKTIATFAAGRENQPLSSSIGVGGGRVLRSRNS